MIDQPFDITKIEKDFFKKKNVLQKILQIALDLLEAKQAGLLYGTDHTMARFLPSDSWDRGVMDKFAGRGLKGMVLKLFGTQIVSAKGLSPIFFYRTDKSGKKVENHGVNAYVLRTYGDFYKQGIKVLIVPNIDTRSDNEGEHYSKIRFYSYNGVALVNPDTLLKADIRVIKQFNARNFITVFLPDYGILVINTADEELLRHEKETFVHEKELKRRLDILIALVEAASLAYLGHLRGKRGAELLFRKEKQLRQTAFNLIKKEMALEKTKRSLLENKERYRDLYDNAPNAYFSTDGNGVITGYNLTATKLLGYDSQTLIGKNAWDLYTETSETRIKSKQIIKHFYNGEPIKDLELQINHREGHPVWVSLSVEIIKDASGGIIETRTMLIDISDRKRLEKQLLQAQKMEAMGTLAGGIAHDFNNILYPISGYAEILSSSYQDDAVLKEKLNQILLGTQKAKALINQILTISRKKTQELKPIKIQIVLKEVLRLIKSLLPATIETIHKIDSDVSPVMADPTQIHQIALNLITNAFHAMEKGGGKLTITLSEVELADPEPGAPEMVPGTYACLTVADTGIGMDKDTLGRIFDPYFTTKKEDKGTGLGLAVVHGIINAHQGSITVNSEKETGTRFKVYLPALEQNTATDDSDKTIFFKKEYQRGNERILLVDDSQQIIEMVYFFLKNLGYSITDCTTSIEAIKIFKKTPGAFDLVITDYTMPEMTGEKLAKEMLALRPDLPIILCTGFSSQITEKKATAMGIKGFLMKPVNTHHLSSLIRKLLDETLPK